MIKNILMITSIFLVLAGCSSKNDYAVINRNPGVGYMVILGDSLANGMGARLSENTPYGCFENNLDLLGISDLSVPGFTVEDTLESVRLNGLLVNGDAPTLVFISAGGNDILRDMQRPGSYPIEDSVNDLIYLIESYQNLGALVVYLMVDPPYNAIASQKLRILADEAAVAGALVVDGMRGFWGTNLMADDFHPNDVGYQILCDRLLDSLDRRYP